MTVRSRWYLLCGLLIAALSPTLAQTASVAAGYTTPRFTVPYATNKPTIDGAVQDAEWQQAMSVTALQTTNRAVSTRQTRFWLAWDENNLYMAMRSPLRKGERVVQALRDRSGDINVVFDDAYELFFDVGTKSPDGQPCFFQFLSNFAGARYDVMFEPAVGNSRLGFTTNWEPKNRITPDGSAWEWELAIPRESLWLKTPFTDGFTMRTLFARDYKRPWEQNSVEGTGNFSMRDTYSTLVLSKSAPAMHLLGVADPANGTLGLSLAAVGREAGTLKWRYDSDGGVAKDGLLTLQPGKLVTADAGLNLETIAGQKPASNMYRIRVLSPDEKTVYLDWSAKRAFGGDTRVATQEINDTGDVAALSLRLNPVKDYLNVMGDFIQFDARNQIAKCTVTVVDAGGKPLASRDMTIDELAYVRDVLPLGTLPAGKYFATLTAYGKDGKVVTTRQTEFEKKDPAKEFAWWNTKVGNAERVLAPWTPVTYKKGELGIWGRTMQVGPAGLPAQVSTQGQPLLAGAVKLVAKLADGKAVTAGAAKTKTLSQADHRVEIGAQSSAGTLKVDSKVTVEYDGMYKVTMTVTPTKPTAVQTLQVVVPFRNDQAEFLHAAGEGIRYGFWYGFVPQGQGRLWDSRSVDGQPMTVGSFIPYVWVGTSKGGLCWFANSDEGWNPNAETPAIELRRDGATSTDLVFNLVSAPATLDAPRTITFAFMATPVRAMKSQWRVDRWWCGNTFYDFSGVEKKGGSIIWTSIPFTLDRDACIKLVDSYHKQSKPEGPINPAVPYWEYNSVGGYAPEVGYFNEQWRLSDNEGFWFDKTFTDFIVYNIHHWAKDTGIDGWYLDNVRPLACAKIEAGRGYRLPDGRIQPVFSTFETREFFLRLRAAFLEAGREPWVVAHMTNNYVAPWTWDFAYDGEHNVIYPESGKDFMDLWSLDRLRLAYGSQWGVPVNFMNEYQGDWDKHPVRYQKVLRSYTGMVGLFDAIPSGNTRWMPVYNAFLAARERFGVGATDVVFKPYWEKNSGVVTGAKDAYTATWVRPGKVLLLVANMGEKGDIAVKLDPKALGLGAPGTWKISDGEAGMQGVFTDPKTGNMTVYPKWDPAIAPITHDGAGTLTIPVERHDYRQVIIETVQ